MFDSEGGDLYGKPACRKGQKQGKDIPIGFDGLIAAAFYTWQVLVEEPVDARLKLHISTFREMAKSKSP